MLSFYHVVRGLSCSTKRFFLFYLLFSQTFPLLLVLLLFLRRCWRTFRDFALHWLLVEECRPENLSPTLVIAIICVIEILHRTRDRIDDRIREACSSCRERRYRVHAMSQRFAVCHTLIWFLVLRVLLEFLQILLPFLSLQLLEFLVLFLLLLRMFLFELEVFLAFL